MPKMKIFEAIDEEGHWRMTEEGAAPIEEAADSAKLMQAGALAGIAKMEIFGVPAGAAAVGLLTASVWDAIAGFAKGTVGNLPNWVVPAVGAMVTAQWFPRFLGRDAANAGALILTADAIQQIFDLRGLISGRFGGMQRRQAPGAETVATGGNGRKEFTSLEEYNRAHGLGG